MLVLTWCTAVPRYIYIVLIGTRYSLKAVIAVQLCPSQSSTTDSLCSLLDNDRTSSTVDHLIPVHDSDLTRFFFLPCAFLLPSLAPQFDEFS